MFNDLGYSHLMFVIMIMIGIYQYIYPVIKKYRTYTQERWELEKKYRRLLKARKDLLMHYDWANSRGNGESLDKMEQMGREIERMD